MIAPIKAGRVLITLAEHAGYHPVIACEYHGSMTWDISEGRYDCTQPGCLVRFTAQDIEMLRKDLTS